ncbi:hypothetical protein MMC09_002120 [Bachmanniomyces sp. S44760]|nr:hypothetical protein [Bachmanniomyces sp. S44760]
MSFHVRERLQDYYEAGIYVYWGIKATIATLFSLIFIQGRANDVFNFASWKDEEFCRVWIPIATMQAQNPSPEVETLLAVAHGVVVDLGPGTGETMHHLTANADKIDHIYGVEPCLELHPLLLQNARAAGFAAKFTIVQSGTQNCRSALAKYGLDTGSVDTIVSIKSLCSVPGDHTLVLNDLYELLKPNGGMMLVMEHVRNREDAVTAIYQRLLNIVWPSLLGNCSLRRDTGRMLLDMGRWQTVELVDRDGRQPWSSIPFVKGKLVKA